MSEKRKEARKERKEIAKDGWRKKRKGMEELMNRYKGQEKMEEEKRVKKKTE